VEEEAAWCQGATSSILNTMVRIIRICGRSWQWWNANIKERRRMVKRKTWRQWNIEEAAWAKVELQESIQQSKRKIWSNCLKSVRGAEVWRAARNTNPRAGIILESLTEVKGKKANTSFEKEEMLSYKSFPPNNGDQFSKQPPTQSAHSRVSEQAVE